MRRSRFLVLGLVLSFSNSVRADFTQQPDETLPGFKSQQVYDFNGVDNVNLFSGELHLAIPLGPEYPLSSGLKWRMTAHYSSKFWHMWIADCGVPSVGCPGQIEVAQRGQAGGYSTLGVGWNLELGWVRPASRTQTSSYKAPDGSVHFLNGPNPDLNANLRLDGPDANGFYVVRQADGTRLHFEHKYSIPATANGFDFSDEDRNNVLTTQPIRYGLSRIVDRFGTTVLQVVYLADYPAPAAWKVDHIQLSNPTRTINYSWGSYAGAGVFDVLNSIQFPVESSGSLTASFSYFAYPQGVRYGRRFDGGGSVHCVSPGPADTNLPLLGSITQSTQRYSFDYARAATNVSGEIVRLTLPTGGHVDYTYSSYTVGTPGVCDVTGPSGCILPELRGGSCATFSGLGPPTAPPSQPLSDPNNCSDWSYYMQFIDQTPSVIQRDENDLTNVTSTGYERDEVGTPETPGTRILDPSRVVRRVLVHRTDGNGGATTVKHIFSAAPWSSGAELSRRTYTTCDGNDAVQGPVRSVVQCYRSANGNVCGVMSNASEINDTATLDLVPSRRETWYGANPIPDLNGCGTTSAVPCWQDDFTAYDPTALEYATVTRSSNSDILVYPPGATRSTTTNWAPTAPGAVPWLPKLYSARIVTDSPCVFAPCAVTTNYSFDAATGFLWSSSTSDAATGTLMHSFTKDPSSGDPLTESLSATFDATTFRNTRTFQSGLAKTVIRSAPAGIGWFSFDVDRDVRTGRITASRDPNGLASTYGYDGLSRLTAVTAPEETPTTYCYFDWSTSGELSAVFAKRAGASCSPDDSVPGAGSGPFEAYQYDGMGRVRREMRRLPNALSSGGYFAFREHRYNSAGLKSFESEWTPCGVSPSATSVRSCYGSVATKGTTYSNFDFLGRARAIQLADGKTITKSFDDPSNVPNSDFTERVTSNVGGVAVNAATRKDIWGRILIAAEPAPAPALFGRYTGYYYNVLDRIAAIALPLGTGDTAHDPPAAPQSRTFAYDALGLLRAEMHPEKGATTFTAYNALGGVLAKSDGGNAYGYAYDALGRLTSTTVNGLPYLTNVYDTDVFGGTVSNNRSLGKLTQQNAYHPLSDQNVRVAHNHGYGGVGGRISVDDHYAIVGNSVLFHAPTTYSWNGLGLLDTHAHARTSGAWSQATTYVSGLPASITADGKPFIPAATYNPAGSLLSYQTANGVTTTLDSDSSLMPRPAQIRTTGADVNFTTGAYAYDGSGNITSIGGDAFQYDARGHLTRGDYAWPGSPFDAYAYDAYGNQTSRTWEAGSQPLTTDVATNRLTASSYDVLGNLTLNGSDQHTYDALSRQTRYVGPGANERYYYDGAGERLARVVFASSLPKQSVQESFFNVTPCRILDTRNGNGTYGGPAIPGQGSRSFPATGVCGIPSNAKALALNVTAVATPGLAAAIGNVRLYPSGLPYQPLGTANAYKAGYPRAIQFFGSIDGPTSGSFTLFNDAPAGRPVDVIVDVQGYFAPGATSPPQTGDSWFLTVRDLEKRPSTEFRYDTATNQASVLRDYVYLGSQLVGTYTTTGTPNGTVFYTNDHLGSPRFLTAGASPTKLAEYRYRAFGLALTNAFPGQGPEFASMERDLASSDLYDHARYVGGRLGRFKSADQLGGHPEDPQSWNRYAYARNNPLRNVDPNGKETVTVLPEVQAVLGTPEGERGANIALGAASSLALAPLLLSSAASGVATFLGTHPQIAALVGSVGLGMVGASTPQQTLQGVANGVGEELSANPALARTVLSQAEYAAGQVNANVARMGFGKAVERLLAREVASDPALSATYRYVSGPNRPDFVGRIGSEAVGITFDVTTRAAVAAHRARPYGIGLEFVTYERPESFRLFP